MPSERILFVDDDPVSRRAFAKAMRKNGFIVDLARDGDEAWELATHFPYAVIATDLSMPGMDGMMLIDQLRELQPDPVCLLVTGVKQLSWYREAGDSTVDVIQKPWNADQLAEALRLAIREYKSRASSIAPSERSIEASEREVVVVGLSGRGRGQVLDALEGHYRPLDAADVGAAAQLIYARPSVVCCLLEESMAGDADLRRLARASRRVPLLVLGSGAAESAGVRAIRNGAQDWLALKSLETAALARAIAMAVERVKAPAGPLPVCTERSNPTLLADRLRQAVSRAQRFSRQAAVLLVDIDRFGDVNASLGHDAGDDLLDLVAERLRISVRESDAAVRLEQDEFALVLEDLGGAETLDVPAQRVLNSFATPFRWRGHEVVLTASMGGAVFPAHGQKPVELLKQARTALEQAKEQGRNRYCAYREPRGALGPPGGGAQLN